jgi:hypothetical protein
MMQSVDEHRDWANGIVARLLHDPMFRQGLLENPGQALRAVGLEYGAQDADGMPLLVVSAAQSAQCPTKSTCSKTCGWKSCGNTCGGRTCTGRTDKKIAE